MCLLAGLEINGWDEVSGQNIIALFLQALNCL